jgi:outer membrane protein OmpA-like peptidoglycan-associated protein
MSTRPVGKCVNFQLCSQADSRQAIPLPARDANPVCPNCSQPLLVTTPVVNPRRNALVAVGIVAVLLFVGLGFALRHYFTSGSSARVAIPAAIPVSAVPVANSSVRTTSPRNVERVGVVGTVAAPPLRSRTVSIPADSPPEYANLLRAAEPVDFALSFKRDSDILDNTANVDVGRLVSLLKTAGYPAHKVFVAGFADNTGDPEYSRFLSAKRAQTVAAELAAHGVTVAQTFGFGQVAPIGDNATPEGREKNRRVEIFVGR